MRKQLVWRGLTLALAVAQVFVGVPASASVPDPAMATPRPPKVRVNRTPPVVRPAPLRPHFSASPTEPEIFRARVFSEPLVPVGGVPTAAQNAALAHAIEAYLAAGASDHTAPWEAFLAEEGASPWRSSVLLGLGLVYERAGRLSRAARAYEEAWKWSKAEVDTRPRSVADLAAGRLAHLLSVLGHLTELRHLLADLESRQVTGTAGALLEQARQSKALMESMPDRSFRCGPMAIDHMLAHGDKAYKPNIRLMMYSASPRGTSLAELQTLSRSLGLRLQMVKRADRAASFPLPAVVHFDVDHFAAVVEAKGDRYLVKDPILSDEVWMTREALDDEASGFALVQEGPLPRGWRQAGDEEAERVWGRGLVEKAKPDARGPDDPNLKCGCSGGMASWGMLTALVGLTIADTPLRYAPARGAGVAFTVRYNQMEDSQPQVFTYWNVGPRWTTDWLAYLEDDPSNPAQPVSAYHRGGGVEVSSGYDVSTGGYEPERRSRAVIVRASADPIRYERRLPDGSVEEYAQPDGALTSPRKVFLTKTTEPDGDTLTFTYDEQLRLVAITDAVGQVTTLTYGGDDPLRLTKVTDPFGREALLDYTGQGLLASITDVIGIVSRFGYEGDFIRTLTTPYGTTRFAFAQRTDGTRILEAIDALGGRERLEFRSSQTLPGEAAPSGYYPQFHAFRNTFYWGTQAMQDAPGDLSAAHIYHWLHTPDGAQMASVLESEKRPNQSRVYHLYPNQPWTGGVGDGRQPSATQRILANGAIQIRRAEYNVRGMKTKDIDPLGRETVYLYGTGAVPDAVPATGTGIDLLQVKQKNAASPGGWDLLSSYTYNAAHQVLTAKDAAGQTTTYTYTASGQVETVTNAKNETTTYAYDTDGRLHTVAGPVAGTTTTYEYDDYGRLWRVTDPEGYQTTTEYDVFDRPTKVTYPDGTTEETVYDRLDPVRHKDRMGRWTETFYDALRRPVATRDAAGRMVQQQYCKCGDAVEKLVDANGNPTGWERDLQGRVTKEIRANGATYTYAYEAESGRLLSVTDPKGNVKTTSYNLDDTVSGISYTLGANTAPTPNVSFTYDTVYNRVSTVVDGTGTTTYAYHPVTAPPSLGAGKLASVDGPLTDDTIEYSYDELGRVVSRQIGSSANTQTQAFDTLGRLTTLTNPLGAFTYTYDGNTGRPTSLLYPNGQQTTWSYYDNVGDHRLRELHNKRPGGATLSRFEYTYDKAGNILTWLQQQDSDPPKVYELGYDAADQLTAAVLKATVPAGQVLKRYYYSYDSAGNRLAEQIDDAVTGASYNNMNQLVSQQAGGALVFKGAVSEPASVAVGGKPATVTADGHFEGQAVVPSGTGQVSVTATDPTGNVRTSTYQVSQGATSKSFTYDLNGNMTSDGTGTYEWDAENRLVAVTEGTNTIARYTYNRGGIRVSKTASGVTTSYVIDGSSIVEERLSTGGVTKHLQGPGIDNVLGMQDGAGTVTHLTRDHLGSIREEVSAAGSTVTQRLIYDPWGNTSASGATTNEWAFAARENDHETGLYYYRTRYYDSALGRFLSEDPSKWRGGPHPLAYAQNNPVRYVDAFGLKPGEPYPTAEAAAIAALTEYFAKSYCSDCEYCFRIYGQGGQRVAGAPFSYTEPAKGGAHACKIPAVPAGMQNAGRAHTHGGPSPRYRGNEFSEVDISGLMTDGGWPGYIATELGSILKYDPVRFAEGLDPVSTVGGLIPLPRCK